MEIIRFTGFSPIIENLKDLQIQYENSSKLKGIYPLKKFFEFPLDLYNNIKEEAEKLNKNLNDINTEDKDIIKDYDSLSSKIYEFYAKIKESSYENIIFNEIKKLLKDLIDYTMGMDIKMNEIKGLDDTGILFEEELNNMNEAHINSVDIYNDDLENNSQISNTSNIINIDENSFIGEAYIIDKKKEIPSIKEEYLKIKEKYKYMSYIANIIVKNKSFNLEPLENIKVSIPDCEFLVDFKKIQDELIIKQYRIPKGILDFSHNFIIPNLNLKFKKGGEKYYPPYGWFGIGLNVKKIYGNNATKNEGDYPIAYYGFENKRSSEIRENIGKMLKKRNIKKILLSPQINKIEKNTGIVFCNNKAYQIALMARVLNNKSEIKQSENGDWKIMFSEIEFIRIIFKEIYI